MSHNGENSRLEELERKLRLAEEYLTLGRKLQLPIHDDFRHFKGYDRIEFATTMKENVMAARAKLEAEAARMEDIYNKRRVPHNFKSGDQVLMRVNMLSSAADEISAGLADKYTGPYTLGKKLGENTFELIAANGKVAAKRNVDVLRKFKQPPVWSHPSALAGSEGSEGGTCAGANLAVPRILRSRKKAAAIDEVCSAHSARLS